MQRPQWTSSSYVVEPGQTRSRKVTVPRRVVRMGTPPSPASDGPRYFPQPPPPAPLPGSIDVEVASAAVAAVTENPPPPPPPSSPSPPLGTMTVRPIVIAPIEDDDDDDDETKKMMMMMNPSLPPSSCL